jgi:hypothetical protein
MQRQMLFRLLRIAYSRRIPFPWSQNRLTFSLEEYRSLITALPIPAKSSKSPAPFLFKYILLPETNEYFMAGRYIYITAPIEGGCKAFHEQNGEGKQDTVFLYTDR